MNDGASELDEELTNESAATRRAKHRTHRSKVIGRRIGRAVALSLGPPLVRLLASTWRSTVVGEENVAAARTYGGGYFMALWHGRMLIPVSRHGRQGYSVLVSASGDGDVSEALLRKIGYGVVRGSTARHGRAALREMLRLLRAGTPLAITPDGPRGPPREMTPGLAWMASATGFPVVPCGFVAANAWRLRSWDRFTIPKPFSRVAFVYGEPVFVARRGEGILETATAEIAVRMNEAERRGFETLGVEPDP
jgi:lysophospholipid acyltransferase (LPLAT)-like uncharacterized protein